MSNTTTLTNFLLVLLALLVNLSWAAQKIWQPPLKQRLGSEICAKSVQMPANLNTFVSFIGVERIMTNEIVFAESGGVLLNDHAEITLVENNEKCETDLLIERPALENWFSSKNWITKDAEVPFNEATPPSEKIPCQRDVAFFPQENFFVNLQFAQKLKLSDVGIVGLKVEDVPNFFESELGQSRFVNSEETLIEIDPCDPKTNCPCALDTLLCYNEECNPPKCLDAIQPAGFCCGICGAAVWFNVGGQTYFDSPKFMSKVKEMLEHSEFAPNSVEYYVYLTDTSSAQLVIVDSQDYDQISPRVAEFLKKNLIDLMYPNGTRTLLKSGLPHDPTANSNAIVYVILPLFVVLVIFGVAYFINYDDRAVPRLLAMIRVRQFNPATFIFARFDNNQNADEVDVNLAPAAAQQPPVEAVPTTAFNNPMFEAAELKETRQAKQMENIKLDEVDLMMTNDEE